MGKTVEGIIKMSPLTLTLSSAILLPTQQLKFILFSVKGK
jgi:hypothetical protein